MPIVRMPNGQNVRFPDDMPRERIKGFILQKFPELGEKVEEKETVNMRPLTENQKAKSKLNPLKEGYEFVGNFAEGTVDGLQNMLNRVRNGASLGLYDKLSSDSRELKDRIQSEADASGMGKEQEVVNEVADFAGSMLPATKSYQITSKVFKPTLALATSGALENGLKEIIKSENMDEATYNGIVGALTGGVTAGTLGFAGKLAKGMWYLTKDSAQKGLSYLKNEIGEDTLNALINKAKEQGRSILEVLDDNFGSILENAKLVSKKAKNIIDKNLPQIKENAREKSYGMIDEVIGTKNGFENVANMKEAADFATKPLFDRVYAYGDISKKSPQVAKLLNENEAIKSIIKEIRNDPYTPDYIKRLPDGDMQIIDRVRQNIEGKTNAFFANPEKIKYKRGDLLYAQNLLLNTVKPVAKGYDEALEAYNQYHLADKATQKTAKFFRNANPKKFATEYEKLSDVEKDAYKLGIKDELETLIGGKSEGATWNTILTPNNQQKIKTVFGTKDGNKIIKYAKEEATRLRNYKKIESAEEVKFKNFLNYLYTKPVNQALDIFSKVVGVNDVSRNSGIAELLTSPTTKAIEEAFAKRNKSLPVKANKYIQDKLGKDYLPISALLGADLFNSNNKL